MAEFVTKKEQKRRFIVMIVCVVFNVLALAAGIWAMKRTSDIEHGEKEPNSLAKIRAKLRQDQEKLDLMRANLIDYAQPVGWRVRSAGTTDPLVTGSLHYSKLELYLDSWVDVFKDPRAGYRVTTPYRKWKGTTKEGELLTLSKLFDELKANEEAFKKEADELQNEIKTTLNSEKKSSDDAEAAAKNAKKVLDGDVPSDQPSAPDSEIGKNKQALINLNQVQKTDAENLAAAEAARDTALAALTKQKKEQSQAEEAYKAQKRELQRRINYRIHRLEEAKERRDPVGEILAVNENNRLAYVDLLRKDRIFRGTKFKVYSLEKGGIKIDKGEVEVIEVREAVSSVVAITKLYDAKNPLKQGDKLYNEYFEKGKTRYIAFAGRFTGKLSNQDAISMIKAFGDVYQEKVDERTSYLIVADGYETSENFKLAQEWGVKIMLERYLYEYLGVP